MTTNEAPLWLADLIQKAASLRTDGEWEPFRPGVEAHWLYRCDGGGPSAGLLRYQPGARVALHEHVGYEHLLVLDGDQYDEYGNYPTGSLVVNPPGTRHSPGSKTGCVALLIYEKAVRFIEPDE